MKKIALVLALLFVPMGTEAVSSNFPHNLANPGKLWLAFPSEGAPLSPFVLVGTDLDSSNLVFVGFGFSPVLWSRSANLPIIGRLTVAVTTVPLLSASGQSEVFMKDGILWGAETNHLPFNVL